MAGTHSAPGVNQEIASHLLKRCRRSGQGITTAEDAIQCAVMANVAYSLLGKKTPHTALEALCIQHQMEVHAECMFIGTSNALDVAPRLQDLENEVAEITSVRRHDDFRKTWKRNQQRCNALLEICADLRNVYQLHDQREEENTILRAFRSWQRLAYINGPEEWINYPLTWRWLKGTTRCVLSAPWAYVNTLIGSGLSLVLISVFWVMAFAGMYDILVGRYALTMERDFIAWQSGSPVSPGDTVAYPTPAIRTQIADLRLDYFTYWLPQSAATFVGMHQYLQGGLHPGIVSDFVAASSVQSQRRTSATGALDHERQLDRFRHLLKVWWYAAVSEMILGYIHLASAVTLLLARFSRK